MKYLKLAILGMILIGLGQVSAWGAGFQLLNEGSARVMALGAAVTARTDMVEAAWYNPSATVFLERPEIMAGMALVAPTVEFKNDNGQDWEMTSMVHPLPFFYATYPLTQRASVNFAFNVPYGLTTDWDGDWPGRYDAVYTSLRCYFFTPSVAFKMGKNLSLGAGVQLVRAEAELRKALIQTTSGEDITTRLTGDDWSAGVLLSLTYRPHPKVTVGLLYRSKVSLKLEGEATYDNTAGTFINTLRGPVPSSLLFRDGAGKVYLNLPDTISLGISTTLIPRWIFSLDLLWTGWSDYEDLRFVFEYKPGTLGQPGEEIQPKNWHDVVSVRVGAEYLLNDRWTLRLGYVYDPSPIDDDTRGPELPTDDRHLFNLGLGYRQGNLSLNLGYTYLIMEDTEPAPAGSEANTSGLQGTYEGEAHIVAFDLRWRF